MEMLVCLNEKLSEWKRCRIVGKLLEFCSVKVKRKKDEFLEGGILYTSPHLTRD